VIVDLVADYVLGEPSPGDDALEARWVSARDIHNLKVSTTTLKLLKARFGFGS
jgi:ADP-ribose pyrophosphatase